MTSPNIRNRGRAEEVAREASHYLEVPDLFAALDAEHANTRAARADEERSAHSAATTGKGVLRWRT